MTETSTQKVAMQIPQAGGALHPEGIYGVNQAAYMVTRPDLCSPSGLVVVAPHAGRKFPAYKIAECEDPFKRGMRHEADRRGDTFTCFLSMGAVNVGAIQLISTIAPGHTNVGRATTSLHEPDIRGGLKGLHADPNDIYAADGQGLVQTCSYHSGEWLYKTGMHPDAQEVKHRIHDNHRPFHASLHTIMNRTAHERGIAFLFDVHSCPSESRIGGKIDVDIILSNADGLSCDPSVMEMAVALAQEFGLRVGVNTPYKGGYNTQTYGAKTLGRKTDLKTESLQIEWNRASYGLNEQTLQIENFDQFARAQAYMNALMSELSDYTAGV